MRLTLDDRQQASARTEGKTRDDNANRQRRTTTEPTIRDTLRNNILAAGAELAVARWLGLRWSAVGNDGGSKTPADVGDDIEVKWTIREHGRLLVKPEDLDGRLHRPFALVTGGPAVYHVAGWVYGDEVKRRGRFLAHWDRPCWSVDQAALREPDSLLDHAAKERIDSRRNRH